MSERFPGGIITKNPATPTGPYESGSAPGVWTLDQQLQYQQQGIWPTAGLQPNYIEDVFSTYLIKTPGSATAVGAVNNGIDLSTKGGMVWLKDRNFGYDHTLVDTARGETQRIRSNTTNAQASTSTYGFTSFNTNGFTLGDGGGVMFDNGSAGTNVASWTFRKQPKFFDVVTYTGDGIAGKTVAHNLGSVPGCIIVKKTSGVENWCVYHVGAGSLWTLELNSTGARDINNNFNYANGLTSTEFQVGSNSPTNSAGATYVAYLFAHNAGGFGLTGTDNVISCGSYTGNGTSVGPTVTLGWEPQWLLIKRASGGTENWYIFDNMRGMPVGSADGYLMPDNSSEEFSFDGVTPTATGFNAANSAAATNASGSTYIYIAIRRGPMKVPTTGASVFDVGTRSGSGSVAKTTSSVLTDLTFIKNRTSGGEYWAWTPRLNGNLTLQSNSTDANLTGAMATNPWDTMTGAFCAASNGATNSGSLIDYSFRRAPGFFDVVCYTQTSTSGDQVVAHNLTVAPELVIIKSRNASYAWNVWPVALNNRLILNQTSAASTFGPISGVTTTSFLEPMYQLGTPIGTTYVTYLFASCPGVSKVFSYTGNGSSQTINCGFTGGARFVMVKRTDSTGNWMVVDTARGLVSAGDPTLYLNSTAAEVTGVDWIDPDNSGFIVNQEGTMNANVSSATYIGLAIA